MSDIVRSDQIISIIAQVRQLRPHLRLGQLIYNALRSDLQEVNLYDYEYNDLANYLAVHYGLDKPSQDVVNFDGDMAN